MLPTIAQGLWLGCRAAQPHDNAYKLSWVWGTNIPAEWLGQTLLSHRRADWTPHLTDATGHWVRVRKHSLCRAWGGAQGRRWSARWTCHQGVEHRATHSDVCGQRCGLNPLQTFWLHLSNHRSTTGQVSAGINSMRRLYKERQCMQRGSWSVIKAEDLKLPYNKVKFLKGQLSEISWSH